MILRASTTVILDSSTGILTVYRDEFFRSDSSGIVTAGYAVKLTEEDKRVVMSEYVSEAEEIFSVEAFLMETNQGRER